MMRKRNRAALLLVAGLWVWTGIGVGAVNLSGNDTNYTVIVQEGDIYEAVYGNQDVLDSAGNVAGGNVTIQGGQITSAVYGGFVSNGTAVKVSDNVVEMHGGQVGQNGQGGVYGGYGKAEIAGNQVIIDGDSEIAYAVFGGYGEISGNTASVHDNTVTIGGNAVIGDNAVYGNIVGGAGNAMNNSVTIQDNAVIRADISGGKNTLIDGDVKNNAVYIKGGTISEGYMVFGGYSLNLNGQHTDVTGNLVEISGGAIKGMVFGGAGYHLVSDNKVILKGNANVEAAVLAGGTSFWDNAEIKNNSLVIDGWCGGNVLDVSDFSTIQLNNSDYLKKARKYGQITG